MKHSKIEFLSAREETNILLNGYETVRGMAFSHTIERKDGQDYYTTKAWAVYHIKSGRIAASGNTPAEALKSLRSKATRDRMISLFDSVACIDESLDYTCPINKPKAMPKPAKPKKERTGIAQVDEALNIINQALLTAPKYSKELHDYLIVKIGKVQYKILLAIENLKAFKDKIIKNAKLFKAA